MTGLFRPALVLFGLFTLTTGIAYPLAVTGAAQVAFPTQANGSLVQRDGRVVGSALIGQAFDAPGYFWGRPSVTGPSAYNGLASTGSNLGPTNPAFLSAVSDRVAALRASHPEHTKDPVPVDLVTASGSGLDAHISPAGARFQVGRVARARGLTEDRLRSLVETHVEERSLGILGEPRVNVLRLNLALDELAGGRH